MNRRSFFQMVFGGAVATAVAPLIQKLSRPRLALRKDAFTVAMEPLAAFQSPFGTLHAGDMFTVEGRWARNPATGRVIVGMPQRFIVTADVTADDPMVPYWPTINQPDLAIDRCRERIL